MSTSINEGGLAKDMTYRDLAALELHKTIVAHRIATQSFGQEVNLRGEALAAFQLADALIQAKEVPFEPPSPT